MNTLKRSANTLERIPTCGYLEHVHSGACIDASGAIVCGLEAHVHTDACYQVSPDDVEIEAAEPVETVVDEASAEQGDLALDLDDTLVAEDVALVASNEAAAPVETEKTFPLGEKTLVSTIIEQLALPVGLDQIETVGAVENDEQTSGLVRVELLEGDWLVSAAQDFDAAELALVLSDDILVVKLVDGRAPVEAVEPEESEREAVEEPALVEPPVIGEPAEVPATAEAEIALPAGDAAPAVAEDIAPVEEDVAPADGEAPASKEEAEEADSDEIEAELPDEEAEQPVEREVEQPAEKEADEQPAKAEAEQPSEKEADDQPVKDEADEQSVEGEAEEQPVKEEVDEQPSEGEADEQPVEKKAEQPAKDEADEQPVEGEADEQPAKEETEEQSAEGETAEQSVKEEAEEQSGEQTAAEEAGEQPSESEEAEQPAESAADEQPAEGEADEQPAEGEEAEQPADGEAPEQPAEGEEVEQPVEEEAEQSAEGEEAEQPADEADEQPIEPVAEQSGEGVAVFSATIDMATIEAYPVSLNALMAMAARDAADARADEEPAPNDVEIADDTDAAEASEDEAESRLWTIEYDHALLEIAEDEQDYLVTPLQGFEETQVTVDNGSRYALTLVHCVFEVDEAGEAPEAAYPAQAFEGQTEYVKVTVTAPEGAFPEGTTMSVADVADAQTLEDIEQTVSEDFVEVKRVHAVDISFFNGEEEVEPLVPISVVMTVTELDQQQEAVVVHVDDDGATEVVESQSEAPEAQGEAVGFEADSFSVYAVVVKETIETKFIDDSGETWSISVGFTKEANIPSGATLKVEEVADEDYLSQAEAALEGGRRVTMARFFDISILDADGAEVQPDVPVAVSITLDNSRVAPVEAGDVHVIDGEAAEVRALHFDAETPSVAPATETQATVAFDAPSFSVWGVVYTVDFYYGDYEYHLTGEGSMTLSALFDVLKIDADAAQAEKVVFSDPALVAVERFEDESDWLLTSLAPFDTEETLTVTMVDGTVYEIRVEDDAEALTITIRAIPSVDAGYLSASSKMLPSEGNQTTYTAGITYNLKKNDGSDTTSRVLDTKNEYALTTNSWNEGHDGNYAFVGFLFETEGVKSGGNTYAEGTSVTPYTFVAKGPKFWISQNTTVNAVFKEKGKTLLYFITDGNGTVNGQSTTYCYTTDNLPTPAPNDANSYHFDHWEVNGESMTEEQLKALTADSVVKAVFAPGPAPSEHTFNYYNVINRITADPYIVTYQDGAAVGAVTRGAPGDQTVFVAWMDDEGHFMTSNETISQATTSDYPATATEDHDYYAYYLWNSRAPQTGPQKYLLGYANLPEGIYWRTDGDNQSGNSKVYIAQLDIAGNLYFDVQPGYELVSVTVNGVDFSTDNFKRTTNNGVKKYTLNYTENFHISKLNAAANRQGLNTMVVTLKEAGTHTVTYVASGNGSVSPTSEINVKDGGTAVGSTATPNSGNYFAYWTDANNNVVSTEQFFQPTNVTADVTYTATFLDNANRIVFYASTPGKILNSSNGYSRGPTVWTSAYGNEYKITVETKEGFKYWELEGSFYSTDTTLTVGTVAAAYTGTHRPILVRAVFSDDAGVVIAYKADEHGSVTNDVDISSSIKGSKAVADEDYVFDGWYHTVYNKETEQNEEVLFSSKQGLSGSDLTTISQNTVLTAKFVPATRLTYQANPHGSLKVNNAAVTSPYTEKVGQDGKVVGAVAVPDTNYGFVGWYKGDTLVGTDAAFVPSGDQVVDGATFTAKFHNLPYVLLSVNMEGWGTVRMNSADGTGKLQELQSAGNGKYRLSNGITASAAEGFVFDHWELDGVDIGHANVNISGDSTNGAYHAFDKFLGIKPLTAVFKPENSITVHYASENEGRGTVSNKVDYISATVPAQGCEVTLVKYNNTNQALLYWYTTESNAKTANWETREVNGQTRYIFPYNGNLTASEVNVDTVWDGITLYAAFGDRVDAITFTVKTDPAGGSQGGFTSGGYTVGSGTYKTRNSEPYEDADLMYLLEGATTSQKAPLCLNQFRNTISGKAKEGNRFAFFLDQDGVAYSSLTGVIRNPDVVGGPVYTAYFTPEDQYRLAFTTDGNGTLTRSDEVPVNVYFVGSSADTYTVTANANDGYTFAGWYDQNGRLVSSNPVFTPSEATADLALTARFRQGTPKGAVTISVNDPAMGKVEIWQYDEKKSENKWQKTDETDENGSTSLTPSTAGETANELYAVANDGYAFVYWTLNGVQIDEKAAQSSNINDQTPVLFEGDELQAVFRKIVYIDENPSGVTGVQMNKGELENWKDSLENKSILQNADKTAQVSATHTQSYNNRVYQIDITAQSNVMDLSADIDLAFVMDASNSMKFPSKLEKLKYPFSNEYYRTVLTQANLNVMADVYGMPRGPFYIISDPSGTSTVYRIYRTTDDGTWYWTDAAYNDTKLIPWTGIERYAEKTPADLYAYYIYKDADVGTRRLDHLNNSLQSAISAAATILQNTGVNHTTSDKAVRVAYDTFAFTTKKVTPGSSFQWEDFALLDASTEMSVAFQDGGTRQDLGLRDAMLFSWDTMQSTKRYAILITDGAPVASNKVSDSIGQDESKIRANVRVQAEALKHAVEGGITLITVGLSTKNVDAGSQLLYDIASDIDGQRQFYEAESGDDLEAILLKILRKIVAHADLRGTVSDTLAATFYPVDADGNPISENAAFKNDETALNTEAFEAAKSNGTACYQWTKEGDLWKVTWYNQLIGWQEDNKDWHGTIYAKTKENFLGGNAIATNAEAKIQPTDYRTNDADGWTNFETAATTLPTPYVNVDELALTQNDTEWTVYLGTEVDPKAQISALYDEILVKKVVSGDQDEMIKRADQMLNGKTDASKTFPLTDVTGQLMSDQITKLLKGEKVTIPYNSGVASSYGNGYVGDIEITLTRQENDCSDKDNHATEKIGVDARFTLTVEYVPKTVELRETEKGITRAQDYHTATDKSHGDPTDTMTSTNSHIINVFAKALQIAKRNVDFSQTLTGAEFKLYRTARASDTSSRVTLPGLAGESFVEVAALNCDGQGVAVRQFTNSDRLGANEHYYLVETKAPAGYYLLTTPIPVTFDISDSYTPVPGGTATQTKPASGLYDWTETASLWFVLNDDQSLSEMIRRVDANGERAADTLTPDSESDTVYYWIINNPGVALPATGGSGTTPIYILGSALIALAILGLALRRKARDLIR